MHNLRIRLAVIDTGGTTIRDDEVVGWKDALGLTSRPASACGAVRTPT